MAPHAAEVQTTKELGAAWSAEMVTLTTMPRTWMIASHAMEVPRVGGGPMLVANAKVACSIQVARMLVSTVKVAARDGGLRRLHGPLDMEH